MRAYASLQGSLPCGPVAAMDDVPQPTCGRTATGDGASDRIRTGDIQDHNLAL